jgi:hypothetical protein
MLCFAHLNHTLCKIAISFRTMGVGIEFLSRTAGERLVMIRSIKKTRQVELCNDLEDDGNDDSVENRHHKKQHPETHHDGCDGSFPSLSNGGGINENILEGNSDHLKSEPHEIKHENNRHNRHNRHDGSIDSGFVDDGSMTVGSISDGNRHSKGGGSEHRLGAESEVSKDESITVWDERTRKIYAKYGAMIPNLLAKEIGASEPEAEKVLYRLVEHYGWRCVPTKAGINNYHPPDPDGPKFGLRDMATPVSRGNKEHFGQEIVTI